VGQLGTQIEFGRYPPFIIPPCHEQVPGPVDFEIQPSAHTVIAAAGSAGTADTVSKLKLTVRKTAGSLRRAALDRDLVRP
jgi:hypothetical protein